MERFHLDATTPEATAQCARALAACLHKGEWVALAGIVGAGKTHFARAAIHYLIGADEIVPSPSFTLVQYYAHILHADFYRISDPHEIDELGIIEDLPTHIGFIEWAENAAQDNEDLSISPSLSPSLSPSISLGQADYHVMLQFPENSKNSEDKSEDTRIITIDASPPRLAALRHHYDRQCQIDGFLATHNFAAYSRHIIAGDASGRSYQRLIKADTNKESVGSVILMDWQIGQDTQDIYNGGIDYVRAARLAEDTPAMCRIMKTLASHINVATIYAADEAAGLVLAQDFGTATLATLPEAARPPIYLEAIETLLTLHTIPDFAPDFLGAYDGAVCAHEASLFVEWYLPYRGINITEEAANAWHKLWQTLGDELYATTKATIILRDYHSVNLHWQNCAAQIYRLGVIDVQDALRGTPAYDVVSLLQDARIDVSAAQTTQSLNHYSQKRFSGDIIAQQDFLRDYALCGAQRNFKIAGIFVRLAKRDNKPSYLDHLPRIIKYIRHNLNHNSLQPVAAWLAAYAPDWDSP